MFRYTSTPSKRACPIVQLLIVSMTAAVIGAITACSGEEQPPTARPQRVDPRPMQTIEAMASQMAVLQTRAAQPRETAGADQNQLTVKPATAVAPVTETPEATATLPPPQKYSPSDNICRRSPGVQNDLIRKLEMSSCQIITVEELFRLDSNFSTTFKESPKQGDFAGMTNLRQLTIRMEIPEGKQEAIPDQLLNGLVKLETLVLELRGRLTINSNAVHNLPELKSIIIRSDGNLTIEKDFVSEVPRLEELEIQVGPNSHLKEHALNNLGRITELTIRWEGPNNDEPRRGTIGQLGYLPRLKYLNIAEEAPVIHAKTFMNLPALETLSVSSSRISLKDESFSENPRLVFIELSAVTTGHRTAFSKLHKLEHLQLGPGRSGNQPEVILSPKSPLMKAILNGQESPRGYIVIPPGGE